MLLQDLYVAFALVLVIEGLMPALSPSSFKRTMGMVTGMNDRSLRTMGLISMSIGASLVYFLTS